jgi:histidinol phosphatase-like PHP family hydrolase
VLPDVNALVFRLLRDLASVQTIKPKAQAYQRAAAVIFALETHITDFTGADGSMPALPGVGPSSLRVLIEVVETGRSATVERAIDASGRRADIEARRTLDANFLSRARVIEILGGRGLKGPSRAAYQGDLQMHSTWSDGRASIATMAQACADRGYQYAAITDHARGLKIARGLTMADVARQHEEIDRLNAAAPTFRILKGIEANIAADGSLDMTEADLGRFDLVLAAPHTNLREIGDQTDRVLRVLATPGVHVLAHPRGRIASSRAGLVADWDFLFAAAAKRKIAVELDGFAERQDLDYAMAASALRAGCLFALDSDAHGPEQLVYAETAIAHARLAGIPASRIVNCWPLQKLLEWTAQLRA